MTNDTAVLRKVLAIVMVAIVTPSYLHASQSEPHLLPVQPNFDTLPPYGKKYAETCERLLFPASSWIVRYFEVIGNPPYDTGLTIYRKPGGGYWLMVKQARPAIGDIVMNAYYGRVNLQSSLASIKIETSNREIPDDVAVEINNLWLTLLRQTRQNSKPDKAYYIHPAKIILWAKDDRQVSRSGKYPPDASKHELFTSIESIVDLLVKSCDAGSQERAGLLRQAAKSARLMRARLNSRWLEEFGKRVRETNRGKEGSVLTIDTRCPIRLLDELARIRDGSNSPVCEFTYDASGNMTQRRIAWFYSSPSNFEYDDLNRVTMNEDGNNSGIYARSHLSVRHGRPGGGRLAGRGRQPGRPVQLGQSWGSELHIVNSVDGG